VQDGALHTCCRRRAYARQWDSGVGNRECWRPSDRRRIGFRKVLLSGPGASDGLAMERVLAASETTWWLSTGLFLHGHGSPDGGLGEQAFSHNPRETYTTVGGAAIGNDTGMEPVAAREALKIRHLGSGKHHAFGNRHLAGIDVALGDVALRICEISIKIRNVILVLLDDLVGARRGLEAIFATAALGFGNQGFSLVEVNPLIREIDDE